MSNVPTSPHAKRNWGTDDTDTQILHLDMDSFYAQVELQLNPHLRGKPVIVASPSARGVVTSATYEARAQGVKAGMPTMAARALVPHAAMLQSPHSVYEEYSQRVMHVIAQLTPVFEQISIDEAFIDVTGSRRRLGNPTHIAHLLRDHIRRATGLPASVGIASVKSVAKIASAHAKPDGILLIPQQATVEFLHSLPVGSLWGVGSVAQNILQRAGIDTIEQLAHTPQQELNKLLGTANAHHLRQLAWGIDPRTVTPRAIEKSISTEHTFEHDLHRPQDVDAFILRAAHECAHRLRAHKMVAWTIGIKVRDSSRNTVTRSVTLSAPTDLGATIAQAGRELFHTLGMPPAGVRLFGVKAENLQPRSHGVPVTLEGPPRQDAAERVMDAVTTRFGAAALRPAAFLTEDI